MSAVPAMVLLSICVLLAGGLLIAVLALVDRIIDARAEKRRRDRIDQSWLRIERKLRAFDQDVHP